MFGFCNVDRLVFVVDCVLLLFVGWVIAGLVNNVGFWVSFSFVYVMWVWVCFDCLCFGVSVWWFHCCLF